MYRGQIRGKEVIIKLSSHVRKQKVDQEKLYQTILAFGEAAFNQQKEQFGIVSKQGLIVASVEQHDLPVISVDYIIPSHHVYE